MLLIVLDFIHSFFWFLVLFSLLFVDWLSEVLLLQEVEAYIDVERKSWKQAGVELSHTPALAHQSNEQNGRTDGRTVLLRTQKHI